MRDTVKLPKGAATLWKLFYSTFVISSFTFGGGYVIVNFMKRKYVDELRWISEQEMMDYIALAQSSPGPIAVNASILVGWHVAGFPGMLVAVLGTALPPLIILSIISFIYSKFVGNPYVALVMRGMKAGVAAVILDVVFTMARHVLKMKSWVHTAVMVLAFFAAFFLKINVVYIILGAAAVGLALALLERRGTHGNAA